MTRSPEAPAVATATKSLATLEREALRLRAEITRMQALRATLRNDASERARRDLLEANQHLVLAALKAQAVAAEAERQRDLAARARQDTEGSAQALADHTMLLEANGNLVQSALHAQENESMAREAQARQQGSMAMAAHELRNPLTPIRLAAGMLDRVRDDLPRLTRLRDIIEAQVVHIERLVEDLLDGSRLNSGKLRLERGPTDLAWVLETAVLTSRPAMDTRHQQLQLDMPAAGAISLLADRMRLVQVFSNLLDNASKYTPEGGCITLTTVASGDSVTVSISDTGIGIPAGALERVFDIFVQDSSAVEFRSTGLGIGLAIVRELVEAHGGTVVGRSDGKDLGSTFSVALPVPVPGQH